VGKDKWSGAVGGKKVEGQGRKIGTEGERRHGRKEQGTEYGNEREKN
jgi:hypothetical protein